MDSSRTAFDIISYLTKEIHKKEKEVRKAETDRIQIRAEYNGLKKRAEEKINELMILLEEQKRELITTKEELKELSTTFEAERTQRDIALEEKNHQPSVNVNTQEDEPSSFHETKEDAEIKNQQETQSIEETPSHNNKFDSQTQTSPHIETKETSISPFPSPTKFSQSQQFPTPQQFPTSQPLESMSPLPSLIPTHSNIAHNSQKTDTPESSNIDANVIESPQSDELNHLPILSDSNLGQAMPEPTLSQSPPKSTADVSCPPRAERELLEEARRLVEEQRREFVELETKYERLQFEYLLLKRNMESKELEENNRKHSVCFQAQKHDEPETTNERNEPHSQTHVIQTPETKQSITYHNSLISTRESDNDMQFASESSSQSQPHHSLPLSSSRPLEIPPSSRRVCFSPVSSIAMTYGQNLDSRDNAKLDWERREIEKELDFAQKQKEMDEYEKERRREKEEAKLRIQQRLASNPAPETVDVLSKTPLPHKTPARMTEMPNVGQAITGGVVRTVGDRGPDNFAPDGD
ncbi:hypothetical protein BLNAU_6970 [Blattamonas nauphoetae]|uniref:Uncharacterized protein n=1 Tax=Blattamonas nauphoetae TaxID=2049346 RepID=A0ABQ9Y304_9EUKA|nr:hypothetical protein BLNAU_6970 [Blattamonas nauphoetae]